MSFVPPSPSRSHSVPRAVEASVYVSGPDVLSLWPLLGLLLAPAGAGADRAAMSRVRAASPGIRLLIEDTAARSPVVRDLLARLGCSDVIVYVEMTASPQIPRARTKLVTASPGVRFLRIGIHASATRADLAPLLAHELQHAVEIAERDEVRDEDGVRRLYMEIGRRGPNDSFETDAALDVENNVRLQYRRDV